MDYEVMVKEAYEEILGVEKTAAPSKKRIDRYKDYYENSDSQQKLMNAAADRHLIRQERAEIRDKMKAAKGTDEYDSLKAKNKALKKERNKNILTQLNPVTNAKANVGHYLKSPGRILLGGYAVPEMLDDNSAKTTVMADTINKRKAERAAEKAAAYYDEAQYIKEAAEADYAEACAYEDAALAILDELGYLED